MSLARLLGLDSGPVLSGATVVLRPPAMGDFKAWRQLRSNSRNFLVPWEPSWPEDDLTRPAFRMRVRACDRDRALGEAYTFFIFLKDQSRLLGGLTLSNIRHGVVQTAILGYWMGEAFAGQGYMRQAVERTLEFAFNELGLHRVEAACLPRNSRSLGLLYRIGFQEEGLARSYLEINGRREDHVLFAILKTDRPSHTKA